MAYEYFKDDAFINDVVKIRCKGLGSKTKLTNRTRPIAVVFDRCAAPYYCRPMSPILRAAVAQPPHPADCRCNNERHRNKNEIHEPLDYNFDEPFPKIRHFYLSRSTAIPNPDSP